MDDRSAHDPTIHDVALRAGVSIRTVSRVLNRSPNVNADTRERIEVAIDALGFAPSLRARALATGRSFLIGLIHDDPNALVLDSVQRGLVATCTARGYEMVVHPAQGDVGETLVDNVRAFIRRSRVDGIMILPPVCEVAGLASALGAPAIALAASRIDGYATMLVSDEREASAEVARHLLSLGHRRIALITGPVGACSAKERRAGFEAALAAAGAPLDPALVLPGDYGFASGLAAAEALLALKEPPTAIFASNDVMAAAVLKVAARRGIAVPDRLSVVGFDGSALAKMLSPALTTIDRPLTEMAARAASRLIDRIEGKAPAGDLSATLSLAVGESTGPAPPPQV